MKLSCFLIPGILLTMTLWSCSKSNNGKPKISIQSMPADIANGQSLDAVVKFTGGSKLSNGSFVAIRLRVNIAPPQNNPPGDTLHIKIPEFSADKGELEYIQPFQGYLTFGDNDNDTLVFKFAVLTESGQSSDTVTSSKVVVHNL